MKSTGLHRGNFVFSKIFYQENLIYERSTLDKRNRICYNVFTMQNQIVPNQIVREADNLSKETGINFRDCLEILFKVDQEKPFPHSRPNRPISTEVCLVSLTART